MSTSEIAKLESRWRDNPQGLTFAPLAEAYRKQKDSRKALEILQPGLERHPDYIPANIVLGRCYWDLGDLEAAEKAFTHVLTLDGENVIALKALADITERQSRPYEAERWLDKLLAVDGSNDEARDQLARIRAVQNLSPVMETPAGLDQAVAPDSSLHSSLEVFDPFPAIVDQLAEEEQFAEPAPVANLDLTTEEVANEALVDEAVVDNALVDEPAAVGPAEPDPAPVPAEYPPAPPAPLVEPEGFRLERAEDIVLNVASGSEFQTRSATDDLMMPEREPSSPEVPAYDPPAPTPLAEPMLEAAPITPQPAHADPPDVAEPDLVVTETMAQVFLRQGHVVEALVVYRELLARDPGSERLRTRVAELEERQRVLSAPPPRPSFLARDTGGQSLGSFFSALLAARLDSSPPSSDGAFGSSELTPEAAPATRPAEEPLSLGSVFGEDPPAVAPAVPPAGAAPADPAPSAPADPVSFDDFFAGAQVPAPAPVPPARPSRAKPDDDLDQFHTWLQSLKR